jgi:hypothetical protein
MPWAPSVLAQWKREKREQRQRYLARKTAERAGAAAAATELVGAQSPEAA